MRADPGPTRPRPAAVVDPDLVEAARILRGALVRVHPSFRFEERLAASLDGLARGTGARGSKASTARHGEEPLIFPLVADVVARPTVGAEPANRSARPTVPAFPGHLAARVPRGVLIGGAIASGVSLAGAALLARRWRARPGNGAFARAVRAAHRGSAGRRDAARRGVA